MARTREIRPWYRWQWHRFANSRKVLRMGLAARGAYRGLLDKSWELGGKLPNDPEIMWRYAGALSAEEFAAVADQVLAMFTVSEDGKWLTNETLTEEWEATDEYLADLSEKRAAAGKKGNEKRWNRKTSQEVAKPSQNIAKYSSNTVAIQDKTPLTPPFDSEEAVDRIYRHYPKVMEEPRSKAAITHALIELSAQMGGDAEAVAFLETMTQKYRLLVMPFKNIPELWDQVPKPWKWFEAKKYNDDAGTWMPVGAQDGKGRDESRSGNSVRAKQNRSFDAIGAALKRKLGDREPDAGGDEVAVPGARDNGRGSGPVIDAVGEVPTAVRAGKGADGDAAHTRDEQVLSQRGRGAGGD